MKLLSLLILIFTSNTLISQDNWKLMDTPPFSPRHHPITFDIDGYGYVLTGAETTGGTNYTKDFYRYDPQNDVWDRLSDYPGPERAFAYGDTYNGKAYIGFGRSGDGSALKDLWEYDPTTLEWTQLPDCPGPGRFHPAFTIAEGKLYVGLGNNFDGNLKDFYEYDIDNMTWRQIDDIPGLPRHHPYYFTIDEVPYAGLGHGNSVGGVLGIYKDFYYFDTAEDEWVAIDSIPAEGRVAGTQFDYDGKGYVLSGQGEDHQNFETGEFWEYDPETENWSELEPHPGSGRWAPGSFLIGHRLYFLAGLSDDRLENSMYMYEMPIPASIFDRTIIKEITYERGSENVVHSEFVDATISIFSLDGKMVLSLNQNKNKNINVSSLNTGVYLIYTEKGIYRFLKD